MKLCYRTLSILNKCYFWNRYKVLTTNYLPTKETRRALSKWVLMLQCWIQVHPCVVHHADLSQCVLGNGRAIRYPSAPTISPIINGVWNSQPGAEYAPVSDIPQSVELRVLVTASYSCPVYESANLVVWPILARPERRGCGTCGATCSSCPTRSELEFWGCLWSSSV